MPELNDIYDLPVNSVHIVKSNLFKALHLIFFFNLFYFFFYFTPFSVCAHKLTQCAPGWWRGVVVLYPDCHTDSHWLNSGAETHT